MRCERGNCDRDEMGGREGFSKRKEIDEMQTGSVRIIHGGGATGAYCLLGWGCGF